MIAKRISYALSRKRLFLKIVLLVFLVSFFSPSWTLPLATLMWTHVQWSATLAPHMNFVPDVTIGGCCLYISFICNVDDQNKTVKNTSRSWISSSLASNFEVQEGNKISWRNRKYRVTRKLVCQERKYLSLVLVFAAGFVLVTYFAFFKSFFDTSRLSLTQTCSLTSQAFQNYSIFLAAQLWRWTRLFL